MSVSTLAQSAIQRQWLAYRQRFAPEFASFYSTLAPPADNLGLVVVIPCYDEPGVVDTINALYVCKRPDCGVEIWVIINASQADDDAIHQQNKSTFEQLAAWAEQFSDEGFRLRCVYKDDFPVKHQGVGLARKTGLDIAASRFAEVGADDGVCISLDADCLVGSNYLYEISNHFDLNQHDQVATIDFRHQLEQVSDAEHSEAMVAYELYLRYYVRGIDYAGLPYAYHTLGSCFAVRVSAYMAQGGMNKRQGGEDFYFIHKFTALGQCGRILSTQVLPSARLSQRVPFGTGPSVSCWATGNDKAYGTYNPAVFHDLRCLTTWLQGLNEKSDFSLEGMKVLPKPLLVFLGRQGVDQRIVEIKANTASIDALVERFLRWFNAFLALKYVHYVHEADYQSQPLIISAQTLLQMSEPMSGSQLGAERAKSRDRLYGLLERYRYLDSKNVT